MEEKSKQVHVIEIEPIIYDDTPTLEFELPEDKTSPDNTPDSIDNDSTRCWGSCP